MAKYIVDTVNKRDFTAGSKARDDIEKILVEEGFEKGNIYVGDEKKRIIREVTSIKRQLHAFFQYVESGSIIVFQYPWGTLSYGMAKIIKSNAEKANSRTILIIHDLNSYRTGNLLTKLYYNSFVKEMKYINNFDYVICHNDVMKNYLIDKGILKTKLYTIDAFDYLFERKVSNCNTNLVERITNEEIKVVNIAGNLSRQKSGYIYTYLATAKINYSVHLYGPYYEGDENGNVKYKGVYSAEELPNIIKSGFGLIWDGPEYNTCGGHFGNYMKINNPHKLSLYMASGIPVFVWKESAAAVFVKKYNVGICISALSDIEEELSKITVHQYAELMQNVHYIKKMIISGDFTKRAVMSIGAI